MATMTANDQFCPPWRPQWEETRFQHLPLSTPAPAPVFPPNIPVTIHDHGQTASSCNMPGAAHSPASPSITVARALREHCKIPFESFFLATYQGRGRFAYYFGPNPIPEREIRTVFKGDKFRQFQKSPPAESETRASQGHMGSQSQQPFAAQGSQSRGQTQPQQQQPQPPQQQPKKRPRKRARSPVMSDLDDEPAPVLTTSKRALQIGDATAVWEFYVKRFACIQQLACRTIAKDIIKVIAPKKQSNNPYAKGTVGAPPWWPEAWGEAVEDQVRHREPDHQKKRERLYLLSHIMKIMADPEQQPPEMRKLNISLSRLTTVTLDSLVTVYGSKTNPTYLKKAAIVQEVFKVARLEARYKRNEIDGTTRTFVTTDDMIMNYCIGDEDADDEDDEYADLENWRSLFRAPAAATTTPSLKQTLPPAHGLTVPIQLQVPSHLGAPAALTQPFPTSHHPYSATENLQTTYKNQSPIACNAVTPAATPQTQNMLLPQNQLHRDNSTNGYSSVFTPASNPGNVTPPSPVFYPQQQQQQPKQHTMAWGTTMTATTTRATAMTGLDPRPDLLPPYPMAVPQHDHVQQQQPATTTFPLVPPPPPLPPPLRRMSATAPALHPPPGFGQAHIAPAPGQMQIHALRQGDGVGHGLGQQLGQQPAQGQTGGYVFGGYSLLSGWVT